VAVGHALAEGRSEAIYLAGANKPSGKRYNQEFGRWLDQHGFRDIPDAARTRLLKCIGRLPEVEAFLGELNTDERLRLNHPVIVWNRFRRELKKLPPKPPTRAPVPDWVKAFNAATPEERVAGFASLSLADFLAILPQEWRDEMMGRVISLGGRKTGTPDERILKLMQAVLVHITTANNRNTSEPVAQGHEREALVKMREITTVMNAINRATGEVAVVWVNADKKRAA
jgi:hypothetical protein